MKRGQKTQRSPSGTLKRSVRTKAFQAQFAGLPDKVREIAEDLFKLFQRDPNDPALETQALHDTKKGRHRNGSKSVRITFRYRAIYVEDNGVDGEGPLQYCWYWVGSREDYANFVNAR